MESQDTVLTVPFEKPGATAAWWKVTEKLGEWMQVCEELGTRRRCIIDLLQPPRAPSPRHFLRDRTLLGSLLAWSIHVCLRGGIRKCDGFDAI